MRPVHLRMVKLKRHSQRRPKETSSILSPYQKRIIEHSAIHTDSPVYLIRCQGGSANDHALRQVMVHTTLGDLTGQPQVFSRELL